MDSIAHRLQQMRQRVDALQREEIYVYQLPIESLDGAWVTVQGRRMLMLASYSYLGLIGHPDITQAAQRAVAKYGTGTHGVRLLAGTLDLHCELERTIARFKQTEEAVVYSSGYVTNLTVVAALLDRDDAVICDKLDHASIVDGCFLSAAKFLRFKHNDPDDLERQLRAAGDRTKLVVVDAVFSMDGDIAPLPEISRLCKQYDAWLMVDEAHSIGLLGASGHGLEEHFDLPPDTIDIKMGTLSKTIPSVGGYIAGSRDLINYLKHASRAYIFSAALPPAQAAAAQCAFGVIEREPERVQRVQANGRLLREGLQSLGFNTLNSETAIVPVITVDDDRAMKLAALCQQQNIFALPVVSPGVPPGLSRLRVVVTAAHSSSDIAQALDVFERAGRQAGVIE
jgi:8-amino-7-oxononanoate synthase